MKKDNDKLKELKSLVMEIYILDNGRMTKLKEMVNSCKLMEDFTRESGIKTWLKDRDDNIYLILDAHTLDSGIMISNMATAKKNGQIARVMKEITQMAQNVDTANTYILMVPFSRVNS